MTLALHGKSARRQALLVIGALLAIVNREETPIDPRADLVVRGELGPTLAFVAGINPGPTAPRVSG